MLRLKKGDLLKVKKSGLAVTVGAAESGKHASAYLKEGEHLLVCEPPTKDEWENWHDTNFVRLLTNQFVSVIVSGNAEFVYCFTTLDGVQDLYGFTMTEVLEIVRC